MGELNGKMIMWECEGSDSETHNPFLLKASAIAIWTGEEKNKK